MRIGLFAALDDRLQLTGPCSLYLLDGQGGEHRQIVQRYLLEQRSGDQINGGSASEQLSHLGHRKLPANHFLLAELADYGFAHSGHGIFSRHEKTRRSGFLYIVPRSAGRGAICCGQPLLANRISFLIERSVPSAVSRLPSTNSTSTTLVLLV